MSANLDTVWESFMKGGSPSSYQGRIRSRRVMDQLSKKVAYNHAYRPTNAKSLSQFLRLKQEDAIKNSTAAPSYSASNGSNPNWTSKIMDEEANDLLQKLQEQASGQYLQNFYNAYMSPANSDICYRLGNVTRTKHNAGFFDANGNPVQTVGSSIYTANGQLTNTTANTCEALGQTDRFGRIDTVSNLRVQIDVEPSSIITKSKLPLTPGYSEYYVNWYFPPFTSDGFDLNTINKARLAATRKAAAQNYKVSVAAAQTEIDKARATAMNLSSLTKMGGLSEDKSSIPTFDPVDLMCARDGFTYRTAGYKAINDNISFLQHIFEECTGVVSTYLTDWDLSLYIQEGLLTEASSGTIWLCNRIEQDNPQGLTGHEALTWGAINAAISKLPLEGTPSSLLPWNPQAFHLSAYWWPYNCPDRGDGLGTFWDYATYSTEDKDKRVANLQKTFLGKIKYDDYVHAAYSGWKTFDDMQFYQALYASPGEELTMVDIIHVQESNGTNESPYTSLTDEIQAIQDALYAENPELGWADHVTTEYEPGGNPNWQMAGGVYDPPHQLPSGAGSWNHCTKHYSYTDPYDSHSRVLEYTDYYMNNNYIATLDKDNAMISRNVNSVDVTGAGNIRILGAEIPGSSALKVFLKRNTYKQAALGIAAKTEKGFGTFGSMANGSAMSEDGTPNPDYLGDIFTPGKDESGRYSNPLGIPRLGPALFGGPHGAFASPQTMQAYFDPDNPFLMSIPRINPAIKSQTDNFSSNNKKDYYEGVEASYMYPAGRQSDQCYIGRSPSETLHILKEGYCEYSVDAEIKVYDKFTEKEQGTITTSIEVTSTQYTNIITVNASYTFPEYKGCYPMEEGGGSRKIEYSSTTPTLETDKDPVKVFVCDDTYTSYTAYKGTNVIEIVREKGKIFALVYNAYLVGDHWDYKVEKYNRPMLHCIPFYAKDQIGNANYSKWIIAKYSASIDPDVTTKEGKFKDFLDAWGSTTPEVQACSQYQMMKRIAGENVSNEKYYRLTMPYFGDNYKDDPASISQGWYDDFEKYVDCYEKAGPIEHKTWTDRYYPEQEFVKFMLKDQTPGTNNWSKIFYCYSNPTDTEAQRKEKGPRALVQIPTRIQQRTCTYNKFVSYAHKCRHKPPCDPCHNDYTEYITDDVSMTYKFIEVDVDAACSFWAAANWSEIYSPNIVNKDIMADIPASKYKVDLPNSVWHLVAPGPAPKRFRFAGKGFTEKDSGDDGGQYLSGWGMYSAMPSFDKRPNQSKFEDANEVLCFQTISGVSDKTPLKDFSFYVPIYSGTVGAVYSSDGCYYYVPYGDNPKCSYVPKPMDDYDPGFANFLRNFYTSCTLFVPEFSDKWDSMRPFTVDISNCLVSALKLLEHQKAYLKFGKELFENSVEAQEVIRMIDKCVDKRISYASTKQKTTSIFYNRWIDKAFELYSDPNANTNVANAFGERINAIDTFIEKANDFMKTVGVDTIDEITAKNWSYKNYLECYEVFSAFSSLCTGLDSKIEDYFYSYLNVLYEYRRFYINKRCNKQDGTLWTCRAFESVIPFMNAAANEETIDPGSIVENSSNGINSYSITMKGLSNNAYDKGKAIVDKTALPRDRIIRLFMPCKPVTQKSWEDFISGRSDVEVIKAIKPDPLNKNNIDIRYYEKPVDDTYQLISTEYISNKQNKDYNALIQNLRDRHIISDSVYRSKLRQVDEEIEDCIFPIIWIKDESKELEKYLASSTEVKEAANKQATANKAYLAAQQAQVEETEKQTKILQAQEQIIENWENTVSYAKQNITTYYDYADTYFYGKDNENNYKKLTQMVDLKGVINADSAIRDTLKAAYKSKYGLSDEEVNTQIQNGFDAINFRDNPSFYGYYARSFNKIEELTGKETIEVIGTAEETFHNNIEEIYSWITQYRDAKDNLSSYEASLAKENKVYEGLKTTADNALKAKQAEVENTRAAYNDTVNNYKAALEKQAKLNKEYQSLRNSKGARAEREKKYTWFADAKRDESSEKYPNILFNLVSGIDLSKVDPTQPLNTPDITLCETGKFVDYWVITIPGTGPLDVGYDTRLKIKTYETDIYDTSSFKANMATTAAGAFAYSLYPITEDQQGAIAAIGASLTDAEKLIESTYS